MIRHVVMWRLAATDEDERAEHASDIARRLGELAAAHPELIRSLQVGANVADPERNFDLMLVADFDDLDALDAYQVHPDHVAIAAFVRSVVTERASADIEL